MELGFGPDLNEKGNVKQVRHRTIYQFYPKLSAPLQCCSVPNVPSTHCMLLNLTCKSRSSAEAWRKER